MEIRLYALSTCMHCRNTKDLLNDYEVVYDCVYVDTLEGDERKSAIAQVREHNPKCSFPTLVIGEHVIVGFQKDKIREALGL